MNFFRILLSVLLFTCASHTFAAEGLITLQSPYSPKVTMDRVESQVLERGLSVFARIDHAAGAASVDLPLRPTELLIFGNPRGGTPFMACEQTLGIDLPLKMLVWEDAAGQAWLAYNDPAYLAARHDAADCVAVDNMAAALSAIAQAAVS